MRVLHISRYAHPRLGGTERFIASLADAVGPLGVESQVLATTRYADVEGPESRIPVTRIPVVGPDKMPKPAGRPGALLRALQWAEVVHVHDLRFLLETTLITRWLRHVPVVLSTHGLIFHTGEFARAKRLLWERYYVPILRRFDLVMAVSEAELDFCERSGLRDNLVLFENPVDLQPYRQVRRSVGGGPLLYFGRLAEHKGIDRLVGLLEAGDPAWRLDIVGRSEKVDQRYVRSLDRAFAPHRDRVSFLGALPEARLLERLAGCACVVLPSRHEAFGLTLVEAMSSGAPVVAQDIPPYRAIAGGTPIGITDFDRPDDAVAEVSRHLASYDAEPARERAELFSWDRRAPELVERYCALFSGGRRGGGSVRGANELPGPDLRAGRPPA